LCHQSELTDQFGNADRIGQIHPAMYRIHFAGSNSECEIAMDSNALLDCPSRDRLSVCIAICIRKDEIANRDLNIALHTNASEDDHSADHWNFRDLQKAGDKMQLL
jgi:hypothetical protein